MGSKRIQRRVEPPESSTAQAQPCTCYDNAACGSNYGRRRLGGRRRNLTPHVRPCNAYPLTSEVLGRRYARRQEYTHFQPAGGTSSRARFEPRSRTAHEAFLRGRRKKGAHNQDDDDAGAFDAARRRWRRAWGTRAEATDAQGASVEKWGSRARSGKSRNGANERRHGQARASPPLPADPHADCVACCRRTLRLPCPPPLHPPRRAGAPSLWAARTRRYDACGRKLGARRVPSSLLRC